MLVRDGRAAALDWVTRNVVGASAFVGAYLAGSVATLPDDAEISATSDIDVMIVLDPVHREKPGKLNHNGTLLEITLLDAAWFRSADTVLSDYHVAAGFARSTLLVDPYGKLMALRRTVMREYPRKSRVEARCHFAADKAAAGLDAVADTGFLPHLVMSWIFPTGVLTHILLVAGLRNPTVRRRYEAARELLKEFGRCDVYATLLETLGATDLTSQDTEQFIEPMSAVFDAAAMVKNAPFPYGSDISPWARRIAIDGSREMIARGSHREAIFWIVVTWCRALSILRYAGGDFAVDQWRIPFHELIGAIGIHDGRDVLERAQRSRALIPALETLAQDIIARNPDVRAG